ncbi:hypothetical protein JIN84_20640 [Luteolibacter yonseiensis]|uniref:Uncharacterized protein n=1 Tax=Luteolibacter yonseiensis TaxID=1144680 RepID=A0A934R440_9BACT|nr:hypothetical protein [Luteolibacter yonseiensis]MBK1818043.1 hypothetical protein [Luteolibacter yonseiensis]
MSRRLQILIATHVLAFAGAVATAKLVMSPAPPRTVPETPRLKSKVSHREPQMNRHDADRLMEVFDGQLIDPPTEYEKLKETLPVAADLEAAALAAVTEYGDRLEQADGTGLTRNEVNELLAVFEVRMLDWMLREPDKAVDFALKNPVCRLIGLNNLLVERVFKDVIHEHGVIASISWLTKSEDLLGALGTCAVDEMKTGGGVATLTALQEAMKGNPYEDQYRTSTQEASDFSENPYDDGPPFFKEAGKNIPFDEKEKLLDFVKRQPDEVSKQLLLSGFARSDARAAPWLLDLIARGVFEGGLAARLKREIGDAVVNLPDMEMNARLEARRLALGNESRSRQALMDDLVMADVGTLLDQGRDWGHEFKNGATSLEDVLTEVKENLPNIPPEGEQALRKALFYQLCVEDPAKALPLLDTMTEEMRRGILSDTAWESHDNARPDYFLGFLQQIPQPVTAAEKDDRTRGWRMRTSGYLERYGREYVEWVRQMPPGFDRDAAVDSVVYSTPDPERARQYREQLSKKDP